MQHNLNRMGIVTLAQLANFNLNVLKKKFGVIGEQLYWHAWGIDLSPVFGNFLKSEQKGFGHGITLLRDYSKDEVATCILDLRSEERGVGKECRYTLVQRGCMVDGVLFRCERR